MEDVLVKAGGIKKCEKGDPGFGGDSWEPWYVGVYQLSVGRQEAVEIIIRIGRESGFDLKSDTSVEDVSAGTVLKDSSKPNPYGEFKGG